MIFILSKDGSQLINAGTMTNIHIKDTKLILDCENGSGSCIGQYQTSAEAKMALSMVYDPISKGCSTKVPNDQSVKGMMANRQLDKTEVHHYNDGRKTKGYGKS